MSRINLFVFAAHHLSNNVAAQRFKGLLKYLDPGKYRVYVFARGAEKITLELDHDGGQGVVHALPGHCVGSEASATAAMPVLASAFFRTLPFVLARGAAQPRQWLMGALDAADALCGKHLEAGERCIAIGTYSPVDSLIAAASLSAKHGITCVQDFRDGLVFEPLGRSGWLASHLRALIERRVVDASGLITSVSGPLVDDFKRRYPNKPVVTLPNGYDPADFTALEHDVELGKQADALLASLVPQGSQVIGHFGRIGASDGSASKSLAYFVEAMNGACESGGSEKVVIFVGELTPFEQSLLKRARFPVAVLGPVARGLALQLMKRCDKLLLITGSRACCATGKLFEYLAVGADVVCVSGVPNAATAILAETKAGTSILTCDGEQGIARLKSALTSSSMVDHRDIGAYSKVEQARLLDQWLSKAVFA